MFERDQVEHISKLPPPPMTVGELRQAKLREVGEACTATIYGGVDVATSDGTKHFSLLGGIQQHNTKAQENILMLQPELPAHTPLTKQETHYRLAILFLMALIFGFFLLEQRVHFTS